MERFLEYVLRHILEFPDELAIFKEVAGTRTIFRLRMRKSDIRRVVGKGGATILAIRSLLDAAASKHGGRATVEIIEDEQAPVPPQPAGAAEAPKTEN